MITNVILASASPRRKELLTLMGLGFTIKPSHKEEVITKKKPSEVVEELAYQKADDIAASESDGLVIGSDTVVAIGDRILGKPSSYEEAVEMIRLLSGHVHRVYTGVSLIEKKNGEIVYEETFSEYADVSVVEMSDEEIHEYVDKGESMDKAGAYGIQGYFSVFVEEIKGEYATVLGLPVSGLYKRLRKRRK